MRLFVLTALRALRLRWAASHARGAPAFVSVCGGLASRAALPDWGMRRLPHMGAHIGAHVHMPSVLAGTHAFKLHIV